MDRFDAYTSEWLAGQIHRAALREAARDRVAREALRAREPDGAADRAAARPDPRLAPVAVR
jgi:hypothetical protein